MKQLSILVLALFTTNLSADDWPQWLGPQRDGVWREKGILKEFPAGGPKVRWRVPVGGAYAGPSIAHGKVVVTDRILAGGTDNPANPFSKEKVGGKERVLCLNEVDGKLLWKHEYPSDYTISYPAGPRCSPAIDGDRVYTLGAMGDLFCFNLSTGAILWSKQLATAYKTDVPFWGFAGHPLVDGDLLICLVGGKGSAVVAFDKRSGKEVWKNLSAENPGYAPPFIQTIDNVRQLIVWTPEEVASLNPRTGEQYWTHPNVKKYIKAGLTVSMPRLEGKQMFFTSFYEGPMMLKVDGAKTPTLDWRGKGRSEQPDETDGIHSIMPTPIFKEGHIYGICSYGELRCIDAKDGSRKWSTHAATTGKSIRWGNAYLIDHEDRTFIFSETGDLILAKLTPAGYTEISRAHLIDPTNTMARAKTDPKRLVNWAHPAFANRSIYVRSDKELICYSLAQE